MILVIGKSGQVATELQMRLPDAQFVDRQALDLTEVGKVASTIQDAKPAAVINATAYTAVDRAEEEEGIAARVNSDAPVEMAQACFNLSIPFVHISTDYVFNGSGDKAFQPNDPTSPLGAYGKTKLKGENGIRAVGGVYGIMRTSWVFSAHGSNFVKTILRLAETRDMLTIVADQIGGPTPAKDIADACVEMTNQLKDAPEKSGTFHFSGGPDVSWADFAREILEQAGVKIKIEDIPTSAYPTPAKRPANSRLDCSLTKSTFGIARPDWKCALRDVLSRLESNP